MVQPRPHPDDLPQRKHLRPARPPKLHKVLSRHLRATQRAGAVCGLPGGLRLPRPRPLAPGPLPRRLRVRRARPARPIAVVPARPLLPAGDQDGRHELVHPHVRRRRLLEGPSDQRHRPARPDAGARRDVVPDLAAGQLQWDRRHGQGDHHRVAPAAHARAGGESVVDTEQAERGGGVRPHAAWLAVRRPGAAAPKRRVDQRPRALHAGRGGYVRCERHGRVGDPEDPQPSADRGLPRRERPTTHVRRLA